MPPVAMRLGTWASLLALLAFSGGCSLIYGPDFSVVGSDTGGIGLDAGRDGGRMDASAPDAGTSDAGRLDAGTMDAGSLPDATLDADTALDATAGMDAGSDGGSDAGSDAGYDAGIDAGFDAGSDAGTDAGSDAGTDAGSDAGRELVWVANSGLNAVQVVNTAVGGGVVATLAVGSAPRRLVFTPGGAVVYVSNETDNTVSAIDTSTSTVTTIPVGTAPRSLAVTPDGTRVYVACGGSHAVFVIATATNTLLPSIPTGAAPGPLSVAVRPDGTELWVTTEGYLQVFSIPAHAAVFTSGWTDGFVAPWTRFLPDGSVFWASSGCGCCGNVQRYSGSTYGQLSDHRLGSPALGLAMSPDGSAVYVGYLGTEGGCTGPAGLVRMSGATGTVALSVSLTKPFVGAVSRDAATLYLARFEDGLSVLDTATLTLARTFALGGMAEDVAVPP